MIYANLMITPILHLLLVNMDGYRRGLCQELKSYRIVSILVKKNSEAHSLNCFFRTKICKKYCSLISYWRAIFSTSFSRSSFYFAPAISMEESSSMSLFACEHSPLPCVDTICTHLLTFCLPMATPKNFSTLHSTLTTLLSRENVFLPLLLLPQQWSYPPQPTFRPAMRPSPNSLRQGGVKSLTQPAVTEAERRRLKSWLHECYFMYSERTHCGP